MRRRRATVTLPTEWAKVSLACCLLPAAAASCASARERVTSRVSSWRSVCVMWGVAVRVGGGRDARAV